MSKSTPGLTAIFFPSGRLRCPISYVSFPRLPVPVPNVRRFPSTDSRCHIPKVTYYLPFGSSTILRSVDSSIFLKYKSGNASPSAQSSNRSE